MVVRDRAVAGTHVRRWRFALMWAPSHVLGGSCGALPLCGRGHHACPRAPIPPPPNCAQVSAGVGPAGRPHLLGPPGTGRAGTRSIGSRPRRSGSGPTSACRCQLHTCPADSGTGCPRIGRSTRRRRRCSRRAAPSSVGTPARGPRRRTRASSAQACAHGFGTIRTSPRRTTELQSRCAHATTAHPVMARWMAPGAKCHGLRFHASKGTGSELELPRGRTRRDTRHPVCRTGGAEGNYFGAQAGAGGTTGQHTEPQQHPRQRQYTYRGVGGYSWVGEISGTPKFWCLAYSSGNPPALGIQADTQHHLSGYTTTGYTTSFCGVHKGHKKNPLGTRTGPDMQYTGPSTSRRKKHVSCRPRGQGMARIALKKIGEGIPAPNLKPPPPPQIVPCRNTPPPLYPEVHINTVVWGKWGRA